MEQFYSYNNNIYKYFEDKKYYLLMTGWDKLERKDRRYKEDELDASKLLKINKNVAHQKINEYWDNVINIWEFNGEMYSNEETYDNAKYYEFKHEYKTQFGECSYCNRYKLVWHQGKLYWAIHFHYYPRVQLYKFKNLNTEPSHKDFVKWASAKYCRGIVNLHNKIKHG